MRAVLLPSRAVALPGGLRCGPRAIELAAWQAHLVKHPLGVDAVRSNRPWSHEGWDATRPPVVTAADRTGLVDRIQALETAGARCGVRELRGARTPYGLGEKEPCYRCEPPLLPRCAEVLDAPDGVGRRYALALEALLAEVADDRAIQVAREEVSSRLLLGLKRPAWIEAGVILAVGVEGKRPAPMVRIARGDGTRADFWLNGKSLAWRTTYRVPQGSVQTRWSFLMDLPAKAPSLPLSDVYVVPRGWWEAHG